MGDTLKPSRVAFALGLIGLGTLSLVFRDFALQWQPVPAWVPLRTPLAIASGAFLVLAGLGVLSRRLAARSARVLFAYLLAWWVLLKLPHVIAAPLIEVNWLGAGEIAVVVAAGWVLFAQGERATRVARYLFAVALIPIGLSHFVYASATIGFVPTWIPFRAFWAYLGGAGHIAAGLGVLFGVLPRLAATLEAAMVAGFTLLVWVPLVVAQPRSQLQWTGFMISWVIAGAAWVVAGSLATKDLGSGDREKDAHSVKAPLDVSISGKRPDSVTKR